MTKYIFRYLKSKQQDVYRLQKGMGQPHVYAKDLAKIKIPLPPLEIQKQIVEEIEVKEKAIESAKEVIKNLERERQYFGKKVSKIEGVRWVELGEVCEIENGSRDRGGALDKGIPSIGGEQISEDGSIKFNKMRYISEDYFETMKKGVLKKGDVLIVKDGATTGKTGFYYGNNIFEKAAVNEHVFILRPKENIIPYFLYSVVKSADFQIKLKSYIKGIIGGITLEIKTIKIPLPPLEIQKKLVEEMEEQEKIIEANKKLIEIMEKKIREVINNI